MSRGPFEPRFEDLPADLPVFPLAGVLLLPGGRLPLNIFEPRYLNMTADAMAAPGRLIGMVQPMEGAPGDALHRVGCAGRICSFQETDDGRYLITLAGVARFKLRDELASLRGYRRVAADWTPFADDLTPEKVAPGSVDRARLIEGLRGFFKQQGITANWDSIAQCLDERLVTSLAMVCPFTAIEKQALLEASGVADRAAQMIAMIEMAAHSPPATDEIARH
jgi:hypothetical protein